MLSSLLQILYVFLCCVAFWYAVFFFFQAEDGIRDLVRSRGLGDVYKRQFLDTCLVQFLLPDFEVNGRQHAVVRVLALRVVEPVSYTHLTLPTSDLV